MSCLINSHFALGSAFDGNGSEFSHIIIDKFCFQLVTNCCVKFSNLGDWRLDQKINYNFIFYI